MTPLEKWLSVATKGLSAESAALVHTEIEQHCEEAREAGVDPVAALGNPRPANRAYRKVLLTAREARMAARLPRRRPRSLRSKIGEWALTIALYWLAALAGWSKLVWFLAARSTPSLIAEFFPPEVPRRRRIFAGLTVARLPLMAAFLLWQHTSAIETAAVTLLLLALDYEGYYQWLPIYRKLAGGQSAILLPRTPKSAGLNSIVSRPETGDRRERYTRATVLLMLLWIMPWSPATFTPTLVWMLLDFYAQQTLPIYTERRGRWYRTAKWTSMAVAAAMPVLYGARAPWTGAIILALLFVLIDLRNISLRRRLPATEWPNRLYW